MTSRLSSKEVSIVAECYVSQSRIEFDRHSAQTLIETFCITALLWMGVTYLIAAPILTCRLLQSSPYWRVKLKACDLLRMSYNLIGGHRKETAEVNKR